jgi:hypothetical protein
LQRHFDNRLFHLKSFFIMGKLTNLISAKVSGNVGAMSFRRRGAETVVAERAYTNSSQGSGATEAQRLHRSRLANIVNFFRVIKRIEARAWENKPAYVSDFNRFTSLNLSNSPVFLTKEEAAANASVIYSYRASRGSLAPMVQSFNGEIFNIGLKLPSGYQLGDKTIAQFSADIIANNEGWQYGDKLSIARLSQAYTTIAGLQVPQVAVIYLEITLDAENSTVLTDVPNTDALQPDVDNDGMFRILDGGDAAFAIHSRETTGKLLTSEQMVIMQNPANAITTRYTSEAQKQLAMASYGYKDAVLLTPYSEVQVEVAEPAIVSSVTLAGAALVDGQTYTQGGQLVISGEQLSRSNVRVVNGSEVYTPQSASATEQTFGIAYPGTYRIYFNGQLAYTFVGDWELNVTASSITFGSRSASSAPLVIPEDESVAASAVALTIVGENLGELTATGGTISNAAGDENRRTATFTPAAADGAFTISSGGVVMVQYAGNGDISF